MKTLLLVVASLVVLALDWAALHDILKQNEPNYVAEWTMLGASVFFFGYLAWLAYPAYPAYRRQAQAGANCARGALTLNL